MEEVSRHGSHWWPSSWTNLSPSLFVRLEPTGWFLESSPVSPSTGISYQFPPIPSRSILPGLKDWGLVHGGLCHYGLVGQFFVDVLTVQWNKLFKERGFQQTKGWWGVGSTSLWPGKSGVLGSLSAVSVCPHFFPFSFLDWKHYQPCLFFTLTCC